MPIEYDEIEVMDRFPAVTGMDPLTDDVWDLYWPIADDKVKSDPFPSPASRVLGACYYIAYLVSGSKSPEHGKYVSESKGLDGGVSKSVALARGMETANVWLDRYKALLNASNAKNIGGGVIRIPPPRTGYRDAVTGHRVRVWWRR